MEADGENASRRVLAVLAAGSAVIARDGDRARLESPRVGVIEVAYAAVERLAEAGLVSLSGERVEIAPAGRETLARLRAARSAAPGAEERSEAIVAPLVNDAESPLALLARRKTREGKPFLTAAEFRAGERLRSDYTRALLMPRLGGSWTTPVQSGARRGGAGGGVELTDVALAARQRVEAAIGGVGPELAGVLVDICCFLKGFETVEIERGWPVRSAKVVLKTALGVLSRHYEPGVRDAAAKPVLHWGAEGYRPSL